MKSNKFVCIAGKNNIAVDVLDYLLTCSNRNYQIGVLCNKTETGIDGWQKSFRKYAKEHKIPEYQLEDLYDVDNLIFISLEYDRIIKPEKFINARLYNIHFSLLPAYKGMYTSVWPILNGEEITGVTFHCIDSGIDTGDIIRQKKIKMERYYTVRDVYEQYIKYGTQLVLECIEDTISNNIKPIRQSPIGSTYYSRKTIDYSNIQIDLHQTAEGIDRQIRAFNFREYQMPVVYGKAIIDTRILSSKSIRKAGTILKQDLMGIRLSTIDYDIMLFYDRLEECLNACKQGDLDVVKEICTVQKHIHERNSKGWTPLIVATYYGHTDIVKYLLSVGADIHDKNYHGTNLLMYAKEAFLKCGNKELFNLFYNMGLKVEEKDFYNKDVVQYLEESEYKLQDIIEE